MTRIGTAFHETLALNRRSVAQVIEVASDDSVELNSKTLRDRTNLGNNYIKAMVPYAVGAGLLGSKDKRLTSLGEAVLEHDPDLNHPATLWLLHYHLSAPEGPGPAFWHYLVGEVLHTGERLERTRIRELLDACLRRNGTELAAKSLNSTTSIFTGTYTKSDALGKLGVLASDADDEGSAKVAESKTFEVQEPDAPPTFALGYALAHFWEQQISALRTDLSELSKPGGFAGLFFLGSFQLNAALRELQREGFLELEQIAPPHQIVKQWSNKETFLERLYE